MVILISFPRHLETLLELISLRIPWDTALQEPLRCLLSVGDRPTERVSVRHILLDGSSGGSLSRRELAFGSLLVRVG
jgi:hypothetical protein